MKFLLSDIKQQIKKHEYHNCTRGLIYFLKFSDGVYLRGGDLDKGGL